MADVAGKADGAAVQEDSPYVVKGIEPFLTVNGGTQAVEFYKKVLGAEELQRHNYSKRKAGEEEPGIMCAILKVGSFKVMVADEAPEPMPAKTVSPTSLSGSAVSLHLNVGNADKFFARAIAEGAKPICEPHDAFWGDRYGQFVDPFGHRWSVAHPLATSEAPAAASEEAAPADAAKDTEKAG